MDNQRQLWIVTVLILSVLIVWIIHDNIVIKTEKRLLSEAHTQHLGFLGQAVLSEIQGRSGAELEDTFLIYSLAERIGAHRIVLLTGEGTVRVDSQGAVKPGAALSRSGLEPSEFREVWEGASRVTGVFREDAATLVRALFLPYYAADGSIEGVVRISLEVPPPPEQSEASATGFLLRLFGTIVGIAAVFTFYRFFQRSRAAGIKEHDRTDTMIETFQGVVRQLKDKEHELEALTQRAEQRAADVESYNENILQSVASGVITFDRDGRITTFNPAAERILRLNREAVIRHSGREVFGEGGAIDRMLNEVLQNERAMSRQEFELHRSSTTPFRSGSSLDWIQRARSGEDRRQERIWVGVTTSLLRDRESKVIGATFVFTDLTEIKHLQEQVELKRRLTVLGEMSAGIAHEFRNFMGAIMGFAKLISKRLEPQDIRQGMVDAITREIQAMDRLIEQLLSFGRQAEVNLAPVNLEAFLHKQVLSVMTSVPDHARPKLKIAIPEGFPKVMIDEILMRQAVGNLLQNAVEAMPHGGELRISAQAGPASVSKDGGDREVLIEIADTGIGISKDKLEKVFLPFFTTKEKGTGMGLALVHKIVLSHNGRIDVDSIEEKGTTFRIHLPLREG